MYGKAIPMMHGEADHLREEACCILLLSDGRCMLCWFRFYSFSQSEQEFEFDIADTVLEAIRVLRQHAEPEEDPNVLDEPWTVWHGSLQLHFQPTKERITVFDNSLEWDVIHLKRHQKVGADGSVFSWRFLYKLCGLAEREDYDAFRDLVDTWKNRWDEARIYEPQADANGRLLVKLHKQQLQLQ